MSPYYHVSSYLNEGQKICRLTKNNFNYCKLICSSEVLTYDEYLNLLKSLRSENIFKKTERDEYKWACEGIFESIRKKFFQQLPSRVWGIYVSDSLEGAKLFNKKYRNNKSKIFEVSPLVKVYQFDMNIFSQAYESLKKDSNSSTYQQAVALAYEYWKCEDIINSQETEFLFDQKEIIIGKQVFPEILIDTTLFFNF